MTSRVDRPPRLSRRVLAGLAAPSIPLSALSLPLVVFLPEFYSGPLGLDLALVGTVFMIVRLADIAFDPVIGAVMDRLQTPIGRYRPWLLAGAPMVMLGMAMLFTAGRGVGPAYLATWLVVAYAGWSTLSLAQLALAANVSPDYHERSRIYGWWQIAFMIGMIMAMLLPKLVAGLGNSDPAAGMRAMAWLVVALTPLLVGFTVIVVRERPIVSSGSASGPREYLGLLRLSVVRRLLLAEALLGVAGGTGATLTVFFFTRVKLLARPDVGLVLIAQFVVSVFSTALWTWLAGRIGKHRALAVSSLLYAATLFGYFAVPAGSLAGAMLVSGVAGIAYSATALLPRAMMADVADEQRLATGANRTGLLFALLIGIWKIGQALSVGLTFVLLDAIGFRAAPGVASSQQAVAGLTMLYIGLPALLSAAAAIAILRYPLTAARHAEIRLALEIRDHEAVRS